MTQNKKKCNSTLDVKWDAQEWKVVVEHPRHGRPSIGRTLTWRSNSLACNIPTKSINQNAAMGQPKQTVNTDRKLQGHV